jgi:elongator complex protein 3
LSEERAARRVIEEIKKKRLDKREFSKLKYRSSLEEGLKRVLKDYEIIKYLKEGEDYLVPLLRGKEVRAASGIYTIAVMAKPWRCPKEEPCIYCPGGVKDGTPQSYLGNEPALMRGVQTGFDPYLQVRYRLDQYRTIGHKPSKVQLIIMGGTFPSTDLDYQEWFVTRCLQAMNHYPEAKPYAWEYLEDAQESNSESQVRCIGITIETRPDWARIPQVDRMIGLGVTLVEIGVQSLDDAILRVVKRGHTTAQVVTATRILRDSGMKVGYHMMPGLPGSDMDRDLADLRRIFEDADFRPDYLKIYPTLVMEGTELHMMWKAGSYRALSNEEAVELLAKAHRFLPKWVRVARIQRDTPAYMIVDGVKRSNLRELVEERLKSQGVRCACIRCREVGLARIRRGGTEELQPRMARETYSAGGGTEEFLSVEDEGKDVLIGFLRLRFPSGKAHRGEVARSGVIRELHVYGTQTAVGERLASGYQHKGWGALLLEAAERITRDEQGLKRIAVLPGVGVRGYYGKKGYSKLPLSNFMVKEL